MSFPIAWSPIYAHPLPEGHRFPMEKYELLPPQLQYEGTITAQQLFSPKPLSLDSILTTHDPAYWNRLSRLQLNEKEQRASGFPHTMELINRERIICSGTVEGALMALDNSSVAFNIAGGTHHAYQDRGEGFCLLNDIAIAANHLMLKTRVKRILIVDLDVHQGNGTAKIFQDDHRVFTFSVHGEKNYPFKKEHSDLDIGLPDGIKDKEYLDLLHAHLPELFDSFKPEFVFFQAGVDILEHDKLGKLQVSINGSKERDKMVLGLCRAMQIPVSVTMGGGYSPRISDIVEAHSNTFRVATELFG